MYIARLARQHDPTKRIMSFWEKGGVDFNYFEKADNKDWLNVFWNEHSVFYALFNQLNLERTLEIACGSGRHSAMVVDRIKTLYLLDSSRGALELARRRFSNNHNVHYILNPGGMGINSEALKNNSLTAIFSYDAMVHFEKRCVESYLKDSFIALQPGNLALFHHSNYDKNPKGEFTDNPGWRNYMNRELFKSMARKWGFEIVHSEIISVSCQDSDCITLLRKPLCSIPAEPLTSSESAPD